MGISTISVVGQGYVGLPLAVLAARSGYRVIGIDRDSAKVEKLNAGISPIGDISDVELREAVTEGTYEARTTFAGVESSEIIVLCVPTPYENETPDLSYIEDAASNVGGLIRKGALIILESTTYPGTTEEVLVPLLERASGMCAGVDFDLAFSPERIDPGNPSYKLQNTPKIVGGLTTHATERAVEFYEHFVEHVVRVSSAATAEMAKLLENTFRHINIALVNELAIVCHDMGIDIWEVIDAAASKPFGFLPFFPGPGVGGHCIPVDPMYLSWRVRQLGGSARFIELARDINNAMPLYCVTRIREILNDRTRSVRNSKVIVLGTAYKANVADIRESPAIPLICALLDEGAIVDYHDPFVPQLSLPKHGTKLSLTFDEVTEARADCVVIVTPHNGVDYQEIVRSGVLVFDTRNHLRSNAPNVITL